MSVFLSAPDSSKASGGPLSENVVDVADDAVLDEAASVAAFAVVASVAASTSPFVSALAKINE